MTHPCIDRLVAAIEAGDGIGGDVFDGHAVLDATVPNWRFTVRGDGAIVKELSGWYASPGHFDELQRNPTPRGELVEFALSWEEDGVPHACHQAHHIEVERGRVVRDTVYCGGRWPASLLAEMEAAGAAG